MRLMLGDYRTGRAGEVVGELLHAMGHENVSLTPGSRSPCDVRSAEGGVGYCTQVRTSATGQLRRLSPGARASLIDCAEAEGRRPVEGYVDLQKRQALLRKRKRSMNTGF